MSAFLSKFIKSAMVLILTAYFAIAGLFLPPDKGELLLAEYMEKTLNYPQKDNAFPYNLKGLKDVHITQALSGPYSINNTKINYNVYGADLGIVFDKGDELFFAFGDTFSQAEFGGNWRSNVLAVSKDRDASDGILFDRMVTKPLGWSAKELIPSLKKDGEEMTTIPTGGFSVGDDMYLCYMSVRTWGDPGIWWCSYGSMAKSTDGGNNWTKLPELQWSGDGKFVQLCPVKQGGYIYFFAVQGGRTGQVNLMRVPEAQVENRAAYEYLIERPEGGQPVYQTGAWAEENAMTVIDAPAGELSVMYNEYLGEWLISYQHNADLILRSAKTIEGPYSDYHYIAKQEDFPGLYCAFMHPVYTEENGRIVYFIMSLWNPIYNAVIVKAEMLR